MPISSFTKSGAKATTPAKLPKTVFEEKIESTTLLKQAFVAQHAEQRAMGAHVKTRGEVRGGGRKPWRQKGTGRARHGSIRSPIWRGGGVTFGPTAERNFSNKLPTTSKRKALRQILSMAASQGDLSIIDDFETKDAKTKSAAQLLNKLNLPTPLLLVVDAKSDVLDRATRNIEGLRVITAKYLNVYRVANAKHVLLTKSAIDTLETILAGSVKAGAKQ